VIYKEITINSRKKCVLYIYSKNIKVIITEQSAAKFQNLHFEKGSETRWIWDVYINEYKQLKV